MSSKCPSFKVNCKSFSLEIYDFHEHFVGRFIILKNASGVVLRKGKWFKFDAAFSSLIFLILFIKQRSRFFRFLHSISTFIRSPVHSIACLLKLVWICGFYINFDGTRLSTRQSHPFFFAFPSSKSPRPRQWIKLNLYFNNLKIVFYFNTCANKCKPCMETCFLRKSNHTTEHTALRSLLVSLNLHSKITSSLFSWK